MPPVPSESRMRAAIDWKNCSDEWMGLRSVIPITKQNLIDGTGPIEHIKEGQKTEEGGPIVPLGKYKGRTVKWLKENDSNYWNWAIENIAIFKRLQ